MDKKKPEEEEGSKSEIETEFPSGKKVVTGKITIDEVMQKGNG
jgi:hypothetical protein